MLRLYSRFTLCSASLPGLHRCGLCYAVVFRPGASPLLAAGKEDTFKMSDTMYATTRILDQDVIDSYRRQGFVHIPNVISPEEVKEFRDAALALVEKMKSFNESGIFTQLVNAWREDPTIRRLTMHPAVASLAEQLAGVPLRLWHDQVLIKQPHNKRPTEFHQDQPLWPHDNKHSSVTAWVALVDVPAERGCMTFIPGSHRRTELAAMNLGDPKSVFEVCPDLMWEPRVTVPLRAGDATFHHGRVAHMAADNTTDEPRVAHVVLLMDAETRYRKQGHPVTDPLNLEDGAPLDNADLFPRLPA